MLIVTYQKAPPMNSLHGAAASTRWHSYYLNKIYAEKSFFLNTLCWLWAMCPWPTIAFGAGEDVRDLSCIFTNRSESAKRG